MGNGNHHMKPAATCVAVAVLIVLAFASEGATLAPEETPQPARKDRGRPAAAAEGKRERFAPRRTARVTRESLPGETTKARRQLQAIPPPPADVTPATLERLRAKAIGLNLQDDILGLWEAAARPEDFVKVGPLGYQAAELVTRGHLCLQMPRPGARMPGPSTNLQEKAWGLTLDEQATPEEQAKGAKRVHAKGKKFLAAPTGERLLTWGDQQVASLAKHTDVLILQAERWMHEDNAPAKPEFTGKVLRFSRVIRTANPDCKIFVELGRRLDRGGGAADELVRGLALLCEKDPSSFDGFYPFITRQETNDPKQGLGALAHLLAWLRPEAVAPAAKGAPAN
jgi:hypothetical protein